MNNKIFTKIPQWNSKEAEQEYKLYVVYMELRNILAMYESTDCYNDITCIEDDIDYFELKFEGIHIMVDVLFGETEWEQKLHRIVSEVEYFVKKYERPGVVLRWKQLNPNLIYFDSAFDLKEDISKEEYLKIQRGLTSLSLNLYPDDELIEQREIYFSNEKNSALMKGEEYSEEKLFEEELLRTLDMVFEYDFWMSEDEVKE